MVPKHCFYCKNYNNFNDNIPLCYEHKIDYDTLHDTIHENGFKIDNYDIVVAKKIKKDDIIFDTWVQNNKRVLYVKKNLKKLIISTNTIITQNYDKYNLVARFKKSKYF